MTASELAEPFHGTVSSPADLGVYGFGIAVGAGSSCALSIISAAFAAGDDVSEMLVLLAAAAVTGVIAFVLGRKPLSTQSLRPVPALSAAVISFLVIAGISSVVYLATGAFDRLDDALYESVTGVSTSALTMLEDPAELGDGLLIWRSGTQWLGGLAALILSVGLMPFLGGSRELADPRGGRRTRETLAPRPAPALKRVAVIYSLVTAVVIFAFAAAGMSVRDAVAHTFSSVSTGGFSTHADSIAHFDSAAIELLMIVVMAGAGSSVALVWMLWRRQYRDTQRAFELRAYGAVLVLGSAWVWWLNRGDDDGAVRGLRQAVFTVVSLATTTGHQVADWGTWHPGSVTLLLVLIAIGGMAGSVAGGLRWIRVIGLVQFVWRELQRQLHPRSVRSVKVGSTTISEASVDRMHAQLVFMLSAGTAGAIALALFGSGIIEAVSLAVSAVSTAGPAFSENHTVANAAALSGPQRAVLMPLMLAGRVFLYPAFVLAAAGFFRAGRFASSARASSADRWSRTRR